MWRHRGGVPFQDVDPRTPPRGIYAKVCFILYTDENADVTGDVPDVANANPGAEVPLEEEEEEVAFGDVLQESDEEQKASEYRSPDDFPETKPYDKRRKVFEPDAW